MRQIVRARQKQKLAEQKAAAEAQDAEHPTVDGEAVVSSPSAEEAVVECRPDVEHLE